MKNPEFKLTPEQEIAGLIDTLGKSLKRINFYGDDKAKNAQLQLLIPKLKQDLTASFDTIVFPEDRIRFAHLFVETYFSDRELLRFRHNSQFLSPEGVARHFLVKAIHYRREQFGPHSPVDSEPLPPSFEADETESEEELLPENR